MYENTIADFAPGDRVELHPALDLWMMGVRYGTVRRIGRSLVHVELDRLPNRLRTFSPRQLRLMS